MEGGPYPAREAGNNTSGTGDELVTYDCYIYAKATITAGKYEAKKCSVSDASNSKYGTCHVNNSDHTSVEDDWLASLAVDFTTDVLKYTVLLNYSQPWISNNLDDYTSGILTLGYHSALNGLMKKLGNETESTTFRSAESVVAASINRSKLYIWLGMNGGLTLSSLLVLLAQCKSRKKTIRNTDLAALMMDFGEIGHSKQAAGLCNAATLNKQDRKLPKMGWAEGTLDVERRGSGGNNLCRRRVIFVENEIRKRRKWKGLGLD